MMKKEWNKGAVEVYFEDIENDKTVRRSYGNTIEQVTSEQVEEFTTILESLTDKPLAHAVLIEHYQYTR